MSVFPLVEINAEKLKMNTIKLREMLEERNISMWAVTKAFCAIPEIAEIIVEGGAKVLADARISNLRKFEDMDVKKVLLRIPMPEEAEEVVELADYSLNSEIHTLRLLGEAAVKAGKIHKVIIMVDLGDLREGVYVDDVEEFVAEAVGIKGISIRGFGVNLTCYGGVIPDENNLGELVSISEEMGKKFNLDIEIISGGNSSSMYLVKEGRLPAGINNLRLGEVLLLGRETAFGQHFENLHRDAFVLKAQLVELKKKPSVPTGKIGKDAFGNTPVYVDKGIIRRGIIAIGRQDVEPSAMHPVDEKIEIIGSSSDHMILDLSKSDKDYRVGDIIEFTMDYACLLRSMTSEYVNIVVIK